jgi:hypothetical protein
MIYKIQTFEESAIATLDIDVNNFLLTINLNKIKSILYNVVHISGNQHHYICTIVYLQ